MLLSQSFLYLQRQSAQTSDLHRSYDGPLLCPSAQGNPNQYSVVWNPAAISAGFVNVTNHVLPPSPIILTVPITVAANTYNGTLTLRNSTTMCVSQNYSISVTVNSCIPPSTMKWILLQDNQANGTCLSSSDCNNDRLCYALEYTPLYTGNMTSYTTGFFVGCNNGANSVLSNVACVMHDNSAIQAFCSQVNMVLFNSSVDGGTPLAVTKGVPKIVHQVCFSIPSTGTLTVTRDNLMGALSASIDSVNGGGPESDTITYYVPLTIDSSIACSLLPVTWLSFNAKPYGDLMSQLDWSTSEEINNSYFNVQRSNDNGRTFGTIGKVNAVPISQAVNTYRFIDAHALNGQNFYRIKQVDFDGKSAASPIRIVSFTGKNKFSINAWPSPALSVLTTDDPTCSRAISYDDCGS